MITPRQADQVPLTRIEVLDFVGDAFGRTPVDRAVLVDAAARAGAREALLVRLHRLPDHLFEEPADLWPHLGDVPEDLQQV